MTVFLFCYFFPFQVLFSEPFFFFKFFFLESLFFFNFSIKHLNFVAQFSQCCLCFIFYFMKFFIFLLKLSSIDVFIRCFSWFSSKLFFFASPVDLISLILTCDGFGRVVLVILLCIFQTKFLVFLRRLVTTLYYHMFQSAYEEV